MCHTLGRQTWVAGVRGGCGQAAPVGAWLARERYFGRLSSAASARKTASMFFAAFWSLHGTEKEGEGGGGHGDGVNNVENNAERVIYPPPISYPPVATLPRAYSSRTVGHVPSPPPPTHTQGVPVHLLVA